MMRHSLQRSSLVLAIQALLAMAPECLISAELSQPATWQAPTAREVYAQIKPWIAATAANANRRAKAEALWSGDAVDRTEDLFERVLDTVVILDKQAADFIRKCRSGEANDLAELSLEILDDPARPDFVLSHLRLLYAQSLASHQLYDEAGDQLSRLEVGMVADPASLLFYQAAIQFRLRQKDKALAILRRLLENETSLPLRFASVARLMEADLQAFEPDSLDEVARLMDSVRVRLGHGRAGKKVRQEEDEVIAKLDKMIDEMEKQRQQSQSAGAANGIQSNQPARDSQLAGGRGQGDVDQKPQGDDTDWGDLPDQAREEALQHVGKDYPSHYRDIIEEYFRTLAREEGREE